MMEVACSHLLVADDDLEICAQLRDYLGKNDFHVTAVSTGKEMLDVIAHEVVDLLLLEPRLRGDDGQQLTSVVRESSSSMPIVVVSRRDEVADRVMGLELGADDYVTKPFSPRELLARIRAVLRRCKVEVAAPVRDGTLRAYRFEGWELNVRLHRLKSPDGGCVEISRGEFSLLRALLSSPQRILTREQLLELTRINTADVYDRSIDTQIMRLRRKIETNPAEPRFIRTERSTGYYFDGSVSEVR
jgi:two-component system OmpR family response regulator